MRSDRACHRSGRDTSAASRDEAGKPKSAERRRHGSFLCARSRVVPMTAGPVVIVGAGHAGFQLAASLRQHGFAERIALLNDEGHLPYQRPPLSKAYLKGTGGPDSLMFRPEKFYHDQNIDLISDRAVVDRPRRAQGLARLRRFARLRPPGAGDRRAQSPARYSQRQSRRRALFADARRKRGAAALHRPGPARRRDRRRIHRPGIRRDRAGQGPRSRRGRTRHRA